MVIVVCITLLLLSFATTPQSLPDILWDPRNPMFDSARCDSSSTKFDAKLNDIIQIICGNEDLNSGSFIKRQYNYNIYVTDNKEDYINRNAENSFHLEDCSQKKVVSNGQMTNFIVVMHKLALQEFDPLGSSYTYKSGKTYFFFTTSNGTKKSLGNTIGDKNSMGFEVTICSIGDSCVGRDRWKVCLYTNKIKVGAQQNYPFKENGTLYTICIGAACFLVGILVVLIFLKLKKYFPKDRSVNSESSSLTCKAKEGNVAFIS